MYNNTLNTCGFVRARLCVPVRARASLCMRLCVRMCACACAPPRIYHYWKNIFSFENISIGPIVLFHDQTDVFKDRKVEISMRYEISAWARFGHFVQGKSQNISKLLPEYRLLEVEVDPYSFNVVTAVPKNYFSWNIFHFYLRLPQG